MRITRPDLFLYTVMASEDTPVNTPETPTPVPGIKIPEPPKPIYGPGDMEGLNEWPNTGNDQPLAPGLDPKKVKPWTEDWQDYGQSWGMAALGLSAVALVVTYLSPIPGDEVFVTGLVLGAAAN